MVCSGAHDLNHILWVNWTRTSTVYLRGVPSWSRSGVTVTTPVSSFGYVHRHFSSVAFTVTDTPMFTGAGRQALPGRVNPQYVPLYGSSRYTQ